MEQKYEIACQIKFVFMAVERKSLSTLFFEISFPIAFSVVHLCSVRRSATTRSKNRKKRETPKSTPETIRIQYVFRSSNT